MEQNTLPNRVAKLTHRWLLCGLRYSLQMNGSSINDCFKELYNACEDGTVVIKLMHKFSEEDNFADSSLRRIEQILKCALQFRNKTLTVILMPRACEKIKSLVHEHVGSMVFVELTEDNADYKAARKYMRQVALADNMKIEKSLYRDVNDPMKTYTASELNEYYQHWYNSQLRTGYYSQ